MLIYISIFFSKILENTLSTLRLILVANGKKKLGAILQGIIALVWIMVTGIVIVNINKDILKIVFFCLGSIVGSYLGSVIEEKIALGNIKIICITKKEYEKKIINNLINYKITSLNQDSNNIILIILLKRKEISKVKYIIKNIDSNSILISEKIKNLD